MSRKGGTKTCNICNLIGHNKLSCPDRPNPTEKPPRKPRTKKTMYEGTSSAPTDQPLRQHRKRNPTTDVIDTVIDTTVDVIDQPARKRHTRNNVEQGTSSKPATLDIRAIMDEMVVQNKEVHRAAEAVLEEVNIISVELTRSLIEKEKNPPNLEFISKALIIDKSTGKKIFNFEILSNPHRTTTTQWYEDLALPPLPKGHAQFKSTGLVYHDPQEKKGLTVSGIKEYQLFSKVMRFHNDITSPLNHLANGKSSDGTRLLHADELEEAMLQSSTIGQGTTTCPSLGREPQSGDDIQKKKKEQNRVEQMDEEEVQVEAKDISYWYSSVPFNRDPVIKQSVLRSDSANHRYDIRFEPKKKIKMSNKVSNFSDLIHLVAPSCLHHQVSAVDVNYPEHDHYTEEDDFHYEEQELMKKFLQNDKKGRATYKQWETKNISRVIEIELLLNQVFDTVSAMKRAYVTLQEAHSPWDPQQMRIADVAVVAELKLLGVFKDRFRRKTKGGVGLLREVVAPYEAALVELKREVKSREADVESLKEKLRVTNGGGRKARTQSRSKVSCIQAQMEPVGELFEATMSQVKECLNSFTSILLSLMRTAYWDISAAVRSIEAASNIFPTDLDPTSVVVAHHANYALESYISRKIFQGFDHETFYMDGSLSSLLNPDQYRHDCFAQYRDMNAMDPVELLEILPNCKFGKFCSKKYLSIVHPKMEESLFGHLEQRNQVMAGNHPRTEFYGEYLGLAKAIWLLHLLAFSLDPAPSQFEANRGADFHPQYMESVMATFPGGQVPASQVVGFPVIPGFKLGNRTIIKTRVYVVPRT
ncbi:hypothetical protein ACFE04_027786 [Oxalis oulophora]